MLFNQQLQSFPVERVLTLEGQVTFRRAPGPAAGGCPTLVLLHGIGSSSASWVLQLAGLSGHARVLAWDAPGYGESSALATGRPSAREYAQRVWAWLDALDIRDPVVLAGHSLGALMAAAASRLAPARVAKLVLLAPAPGYARAEPAVRASKLGERLALLERLGPAGLAEQRGAAMLSQQATPDMVDFTKQVMAGIRVAGYTQATHMLAGGDLLADLETLDLPVVVASGSADTVTPVANCKALAGAVGRTYVDLGPVGHACALEAGEQVNALLRDCMRVPA